MATRRVASRAVAWSVVHSWGSSFFSFIIAVVLARLLAPEDFGLVAMALVYVRFVSFFVDQGLGSALIQRARLDRAHLDSAFWISMSASAGLALGSLALADPIAGAFGQAELGNIVRLLSLSLIFSGLQSTQKAVLQRELAFRPLAIRAVAANVIGGTAGIVAAVAGWGVWSLVVQLLTAELVSTVLLWRVSGWRPRLRFSRVHAGDLYGFSVSVFVSNLLSFANSHSDDLLIGLFLGPVALGYYTIAYDMLRKMITLLVNVINRVAFPLFSRAQDDPDRVRNGFYTATRMTSLIAFPAFTGIIAVAPEFIETVYGAKWNTSIPVLQVLSIVGIYSAVFSFNSSLMLASGKASWRMWLSLMTTIVSLIGFVVAVRWGIVAVAGAYVASRYLLVPVYLWLLKKLVQFDTRTYLLQFGMPLLGSLIMFGSVLALRALLPEVVDTSLRLILYILVGGAVYTGFIYLRQPDLVKQLLATGRRLWTGLRRRARGRRSA